MPGWKPGLFYGCLPSTNSNAADNADLEDIPPKCPRGNSWPFRITKRIGTSKVAASLANLLDNVPPSHLNIACPELRSSQRDSSFVLSTAEGKVCLCMVKSLHTFRQGDGIFEGNTHAFLIPCRRPPGRCLTFKRPETFSMGHCENAMRKLPVFSF